MLDENEELRFICDEADIALGKKTQKKFAENGILSFQDLLHNVSKLDPDKGAENDLLKVVDWYKWFQQTHTRDAIMAVGGDFTEAAFEEFKQSNRTVAIPSKAFSDVYSLFKGDKNFKGIARDQVLMSQIEDQTVNNIEVDMTEELKKGVGNFDYNGFAREVVSAVYGKQETQQLAFVAGKTQSGKSAVKAVGMLAGSAVKVPQVLITKGVKESQELVNKLRDFFQGKQQQKYVVGLSSPDIHGTKTVGKRKREEIEMALKFSGTIVLADTAAQVKKITKALKSCSEDNENFEFLLMVDECDAVVCRTSDRRTLVEQAYDTLMDMKPSLAVMISATPMPLMFEVIFQDDYNSTTLAGVFNIEPVEDYFGIHDMELLKDENGEAVYLDAKELTLRNNYTSSSDIKLITDALQDPSKKGVLLLDCTNPRVNAPGNVRQKADGVQKLCKETFQRDVVVMINIGSGVEVKPPGATWQTKRGLDVDEVIEEIDEKYGLDTPLLCFGFSKMSRGTSYRSSCRVPTHTNVGLKNGHNAMNMVQALGRATFNGWSVLRQNGFKAVTLLTTPSDYTTAKKLLTYVDQICERSKSGESFADALTGAKRAIGDDANFNRHSARPISRLKRHKEQLQNNVNFENPPEELSKEENHVKSKYFDEDEHQKLLRTACEVACEHREFCAGDIKDAFDDTFQDDEISIAKTKLRKILREFVDDSLIQKLAGESGKDTSWESAKDTWYRVPYPRRLCKYLNRDLALTREEKEDGDSLEELFRFTTRSYVESSEEDEDDDSSTETQAEIVPPNKARTIVPDAVAQVDTVDQNENLPRASGGAQQKDCMQKANVVDCVEQRPGEEEASQDDLQERHTIDPKPVASKKSNRMTGSVVSEVEHRPEYLANSAAKETDRNNVDMKLVANVNPGSTQNSCGAVSEPDSLMENFVTNPKDCMHKASVVGCVEHPEEDGASQDDLLEQHSIDSKPVASKKRKRMTGSIVDEVKNCPEYPANNATKETDQNNGDMELVANVTPSSTQNSCGAPSPPESMMENIVKRLRFC